MSKLAIIFAALCITASSSVKNDEDMNKMAPVPAPGNDKAAENDQDMMSMQGDKEMALPDLDAIMNECNQSFRIEMAFLEALNDSGTFPDETDKTPKCYMRCFLEKTGVASSEGQYDAARAVVVFAKERSGRSHDDLEESARACTERSESCKCERAYNFMRCMVEKDIEKHEPPYRGEAEEDS